MSYVGLIIAVALIAGLAIFSGAKKSGKKSAGISSPVAAGLIMGTLVGGSSTVGTAQLAYNYGMSAWWFTLGSGIACLVLGLVFLKPMRRENCPTLVGMINKEYGPKAGLAASALNSVGTFINILSQLLAASAVVLVVLPQLGSGWTIVISAVFMALYVVFGGAKGAGLAGILKLVLLYVAMVSCGVIALKLIGGVDGLQSAIDRFSLETGRNFANLFCRGVGTDLGACVSLLLGVLTTQTYAQAVLSAKSDGHARGAAVMSAFLIPPIGIFGILVGLYMRTVTDPTVFTAKAALTSFILDYSGMPTLLAGIVLGALFIASVGTGAGLALGVATIVDREMIHRNGRQLKISSENTGKLLIVVVLAAASLLAVVVPSDTILNFAFMSMGLRGCTVFAPLCFLLWGKGKVSGKYALASIVSGSVVALVMGVLNLFEIIHLPCDAVFPGVAVGLIVMIVGYFRREKHTLVL